MMGFLAAIIRARRGVAAVELALAMPFLMTMLAGTVETVSFLRASGKIQAIAFATADLITQKKTLSTARLNDVFRAGDLMIEPLPAGSLQIGIASVSFRDDDGQPVLDWTESRNGGAVTDPLGLAAGKAGPGQSVVMVTIDYNYAPVFGSLIFGNLTLKETVFSRPRSSATLVRS